jgi:hypothetical protein
MNPVRRQRLLNDVLEMAPFRAHPVISWKALDSGTPPESFQFVYNIPSYRLGHSTRSLHRTWALKVRIPAEYPRPGCFSFSHVSFEGAIPYNPHVFADGNVCIGGFSGVETLWGLAKRIGLILQLDPETLQYGSPANSEALNALRSGTLKSPCDRTPLPGAPAAVSPLFSLRPRG